MYWVFFASIVFVVIGFYIKGPILALGVSWLVATGPLVISILEFNDSQGSDNLYEFKLLAYISIMAFGIFYGRIFSDKYIAHVAPAVSGIKEIKFESDRIVYVWYAAAVSIICQTIDFIRMAPSGIDDLTLLRDLFQTRVSTPFTLVANVTSWACLYCFAYMRFHQKNLSKKNVALLLVPSAGFFLISYFSAGRQAAFQIILFLLIFNGNKDAKNIAHKFDLQKYLIITALVFYMLYIALARNDGSISNNKADALAVMFNFEYGSMLLLLMDYFSVDFVSAIVETVVYFSGPIALFREFLNVPGIESFGSYGAMSFPFVLRQFEFITNISVIGLLDKKMQIMYSAGLMGAGWTTAISSHILDFGLYGAGVFLFLQGFLCQYFWDVSKKLNNLNANIISALLIISIIYLPLIPAFSETTLLLLIILAYLFYKKDFNVSNTKNTL